MFRKVETMNTFKGDLACVTGTVIYASYVYFRKEGKASFTHDYDGSLSNFWTLKIPEQISKNSQLKNTADVMIRYKATQQIQLARNPNFKKDLQQKPKKSYSRSPIVFNQDYSYESMIATLKGLLFLSYTV